LNTLLDLDLAIIEEAYQANTPRASSVPSGWRRSAMSPAGSPTSFAIR
jgi:hypothetical protein